MIVIECLKDYPVDGKPCILTLFAEGGAIQHFEDKAVIIGKWKVLKTHGRLIDADELERILDEVNGYGGASEITYKKMIEILHDETLSPTIVEASE